MVYAMATKSHVTSLPRLTMSYYFILFCSLFLSHPLYTSYFMFLKFLSYLSPLLIITSLLLLLLLTFSPGLIIDKNTCMTAKSKSKLAFFRGFLEKLRPNAADDEKEEFVHQGSEECEVYKILFEVPEVKVKAKAKAKVQENGLELELLEPKHELVPVDKFLIRGEDDVRDGIKIENSEEEHQDAKNSTVEENSGAGGQKNKTLEESISGRVEPPEDDTEQKEEEVNAKQWDSHSQSNRVGEAKKDPIENMESDPLLFNKEIVIGNIKERGGVRFTRRLGGSVRLTSSEYKHKIGYKEMGLDNYRYSALGGSMRMREKEWKRTLACKLYEERNGGCIADDDDDDGEGMDLLWETYENDSTTTVEMQTKSKTEKSENYDDDDDDDDDQEEEEKKLCCLQVLKFSAGKMGRRPNLVKISKALTFRGMGLGFLKNKHGTRTR